MSDGMTSPSYLMALIANDDPLFDFLVEVLILLP